MATDQNRSDLDDNDEPSDEEIKRQEKSTQDWKRDNSRDLPMRDEERPLKP